MTLHKIFRLLLAAVCFISLPDMAGALTADDILVVFNDNFPGSREVAQHYIDKRKVPTKNMIGLSLPNSENISRQAYEKLLAKPLKKIAGQFIAKEQKPTILLIHGVPLKIDESTPRNTIDKNIISQKIDELSITLEDLSARLAGLISFEGQLPRANNNLKSIIELTEAIISKAIEFQNDTTKGPDPAKIEASSLIIRLAGINSVARGLAKKAATDPRSSLTNDYLYKLNTIINTQLGLLPFLGITDQNKWDSASLVRTSRGILGEFKFWRSQWELNSTEMTSAAVDSELTLILTDSYFKPKWLPNPYLTQFDQTPGIGPIRNQVVMTARIDGPTPEIAKRLIDDAIEIEQRGLDGTFYIDARYPAKENPKGYYEIYNNHLFMLAEILKKNSSMKVVLNDKSELFKENCCPDAALYCGWYSLGRYVNSFLWNKGAVGFHVASSEASTLRQPASTVWCKRMIEEGVTATLGPVSEPYLQSFPLPDVYFPLLMSGRLPLAEVFFRSIPYLSWRQVLVGDPLYSPFKHKPAIAINE